VTKSGRCGDKQKRFSGILRKISDSICSDPERFREWLDQAHVVEFVPLASRSKYIITDGGLSVTLVFKGREGGLIRIDCTFEALRGIVQLSRRDPEELLAIDAVLRERRREWIDEMR